MTTKLCLSCGRAGHWGRSGRCDDCRRALNRDRDRERDATPERKAQKRKYSGPHRAARRRWLPGVLAGVVHCWRPDCGVLLSGNVWHLGHRDNRPSHPECIPCNLKHSSDNKSQPKENNP